MATRFAPSCDTAFDRDGLHYPFGKRTPEPGALVEIAAGLHWWRVPMSGPLKHVNGYLLDEPDGSVTVVDTGPNSTVSLDAWKTLLARPLAGRRIAGVICTHMHPDHVGLAGWLCRQSGAPLLMTRGEWLMVRMLTADRRDEVPPEMVAFWRAAGWDDAQVAHASERGWGNFARIVSHLPLGFVRLRDGDTWRLGGRDWRVVVGSGHSPEHACLLDVERGILIAGDQVLPRISSNVSLTVSEPEADPLGEWLASIDRLRGLPAGLLVLPGHGDPFTGLHARLDQLDAEHAARLETLAAHLTEPRRAVDCFAQLFRRPIGPDVLGMATGESLAHLRHLEMTGRAVREIHEGIWLFSHAA